MKKVIVLFLVFLSMSAQSATIDERKVDFYFGNGVWNDKTDAQYGQGKLQDFLKDLDINTKVKLAFNHTQGKRADLVETFYQLALNKQISFGYFTMLANAMLADVPKPLQVLYLQGMMAEEAEDILVMTENYQKAINDGHKVILVSHSQGNMFGLRSYDSLDGWQKKYFKQVSIATPANRIANNPYWVTASWDLVIKKLVDIAIIGNNSLDANVPNTFDVDDKSGHLFVKTYLMGEKTSKEIKSAIANTYKESKKTLSQWKTKSEISEEGKKDYRLIVEHRYKPNTIMMNSEVYPFDASKYLYEAKDTNGVFHYVKASLGGKKILNKWDGQEEKTEFYKLEGTGEIIKGEEDDEINIPAKDGIITIDLTWTNPSTDMNLAFDAGEKDISDIEGLAREHYYVATQDDIAPGIYGIYINGSMKMGEEFDSEFIGINIKAPGNNNAVFAIKANSQEELDIGHIADIEISEQKMVKVTPAPHAPSKPTIIPICQGEECHKIFSNGDVEPKYLYEIISQLSQALAGPLSDADIEVYKADQFKGENQALFTGATSIGSSIFTSGLINFPAIFRNALDDDTYYVVAIKGGKDIDTDDDMILDETPTANNGIFHVLLTGKEIKDRGFKVNILTEIAFQLSKEEMKQENTVLSAHLDELASRIFKDDILKDGVINKTDLFKWIPSNHKKSLKFDYDDDIKPIVYKVYSDEDVYQDAYDLLYGVHVVLTDIYANEDILGASVVQKLNLDSVYDPITKITLSGEDSHLFTVDMQGNIRLKEAVVLDYETKQNYNFTISISTNKASISKEITFWVNNILDTVPRINDTTITISNPPLGTKIGEVKIYKEHDSILSSVVIDGSDKESFHIDLDGNITTTKELDKDAYELQIKAINAVGESDSATLKIKVVQKGNFQDLNLTIKRSEPVNIRNTDYKNDEIFYDNIIGTIPATLFGLSADEYSYTIDSPLFGIYKSKRECELYNNMSVNKIVCQDRSLYLKKSLMQEPIIPLHHITVTARDQFGIEEQIKVNISVTIVNGFTMTIEDNTEENRKVGSVYIGLRDDEKISVLLEGEGSEDFTLNDNGTLKVNVNTRLARTIVSEYHLTAVINDIYKTPITIMISDRYARDENPEILLDNDIGIMWQDNIDTKKLDVSHGAATDYCENLFFGGYEDWRLPTSTELESIVNLTTTNNIIKEMRNHAKSWYWTDLKEFVLNQDGQIQRSFNETTNLFHCVRTNKLITKYFIYKTDFIIEEEKEVGETVVELDTSGIGDTIVEASTSGEDSMYFSVDTKGVITIKEGVVLNYQEQVNYVVNVTLKTDYGFITKEIKIDFDIVFNENEIVYDPETQLYWQDDIDAKEISMNWQDSVEYCNNLTLGAYTDWRLPSVQDLFSITVMGQQPAIKEDFHNYSSTYGYWSADSAGATRATQLHFEVPSDSGFKLQAVDKLEYGNIRCVRTGL